MRRFRFIASGRRDPCTARRPCLIPLGDANTNLLTPKRLHTGAHGSFEPDRRVVDADTTRPQCDEAVRAALRLNPQQSRARRSTRSCRRLTSSRERTLRPRPSRARSLHVTREAATGVSIAPTEVALWPRGGRAGGSEKRRSVNLGTPLMLSSSGCCAGRCRRTRVRWSGPTAGPTRGPTGGHRAPKVSAPHTTPAHPLRSPVLAYAAGTDARAASRTARGRRCKIAL